MKTEIKNQLYALWLQAGNSGSEEDFMAAWLGPPAPSLYELWLQDGNTGSKEDFDAWLGFLEDGKDFQSHDLNEVLNEEMHILVFDHFKREKLGIDKLANKED